MSSNTSNSTSGVTGNTPAATNAAAGAQATSARATFWQKNSKAVIMVMAAIALVTSVIVYTSAGVRIGGLIVTGLIIWYIGKQWSKGLDTSWGSILKYVGIVVIVITLLPSNFVQKPLEGLNWANKELGEVDMTKLASTTSAADKCKGPCLGPEPTPVRLKSDPVLIDASQLRPGVDKVYYDIDHTDPKYVTLRDPDQFIEKRDWVWRGSTRFYRIFPKVSATAAYPEGVPIAVFSQSSK
jgi:hypothetical protein